MMGYTSPTEISLKSWVQIHRKDVLSSGTVSTIPHPSPWRPFLSTSTRGQWTFSGSSRQHIPFELNKPNRKSLSVLVQYPMVRDSQYDGLGDLVERYQWDKIGDGGFVG